MARDLYSQILIQRQIIKQDRELRQNAILSKYPLSKLREARDRLCLSCTWWLPDKKGCFHQLLPITLDGSDCPYASGAGVAIKHSPVRPRRIS